jgi:hypothetical protein
MTTLKKHNYRLDAAVDAYYQALTDAPPAPVSTQKLGQLFDKYKGKLTCPSPFDFLLTYEA